MKALHVVAFILVIVGALNWGLVGAGGWDLVAMLLGTGVLAKIVYILVGLSGVLMLVTHCKDCKHCEKKPEVQI
jgi:uncharacterized membrane protein YuzA (DUF378 family)